MNDSERSEWIDNDEGLYRDWISSNLSKKEYIRKNRQWIDRVIEAITSGSKQPHFLEYDKDERDLRRRYR